MYLALSNSFQDCFRRNDQYTLQKSCSILVFLIKKTGKFRKNIFLNYLSLNNSN